MNIRFRLNYSSAVFAVAMALATGAYAEGVRQSPINIEKKDVVNVHHAPRITAVYQSNATLNVVNTYNPHRVPHLDKEWATLRATPSGSSYVMVGHQQYDLLQFHFHTPSEHKVNDKGTPMEVHFVHLKSGALPCDPDALLVIGAMIKQGSDAYTELNKILDLRIGDRGHFGGAAARNELHKIFDRGDLPEDSTEPATIITNFNLNKVLPKLDDSWRYSGSLTAPSTFTNCTAQGGSIEDQLSADIFPENVQWVLLTQPIELPKHQIHTFKHLFEEGNSRETQPLNGRPVYHVHH
jgi:carbonic anhydrase